MIAQLSWTARTWRFDQPLGLFPCVVERLRGTPARIAELISNANTEQLTSRPAEGEWSVNEHIGHLDDLDDLDRTRLGEYLRGSATLTAADMTNRRTHEGRHNERPTQDLLATFAASRQALVAQLEQLDEDVVGRSALHPRLQMPMRLIDWTVFVAEHDDHHVARISALLRGLAIVLLATILLALPRSAFAQQKGSVVVEYLANEGVHVRGSSVAVLFDALFRDGLAMYPTVQQPLRDSLEMSAGRWAGNTVLLVTHGHRDHFNSEAVTRFLSSNPRAVVVLPTDARDSLKARRADVTRARPAIARVAITAIPGARITPLGIPHGQPAKGNVQHSAYLVEVDGVSILHVGDTTTPPDEWTNLGLPRRRIDVVLAPFWLLNSGNAAWIHTNLQPQLVLPIHAGADAPAGVRRAPGQTYRVEAR